MKLTEMEMSGLLDCMGLFQDPVSNFEFHHLVIFFREGPNQKL